MHSKKINRRELIGAMGAAAGAAVAFGCGAYASRGSNPMSNASDGIFADSLSSELITPTGSTASGFAATFQVGVAI